MSDEPALVDQYLDEARSLRTALPDEATLLLRSRDGDKEAKREVIKSYLSVAAEIGLRLAPEGLTQLEAIQQANLVLLRIIDGGESPARVISDRIAQHFDTLR